MENRKHVAPIGDEGLYILDTGSWRNFRPVINQGKCIKCGLCFTFCPVNSISKVDNVYQISMSYCKGCGICAHECPRKAIDMVSEGCSLDTVSDDSKSADQDATSAFKGGKNT